MARLCLAPWVILAIACGPSPRQAQSSQQRYEQCYGADFDPYVPVDRRRDCWARWLELRVEDDPPEHVRYAEMRLAQLAVNGATRPLPDPKPEPPPSYVHAYPRSPPSVYPTTACTPLCNERWSECTRHCQMRDEPCATACEAAYRVCDEACP